MLIVVVVVVGCGVVGCVVVVVVAVVVVVVQSGETMDLPHNTATSHATHIQKSEHTMLLGGVCLFVIDYLI